MKHITPYLGLFQDTAMCFNASPENEITILEIGVRDGLSTNAFLRGLALRKAQGDWGSGKLYSIDIKDCSRVVSLKKEFWEFILGDSTKVPWNRPIDIFFIDGDHSAEGAKTDYYKYLPYVKKGGIIFIHDVGHPKLGVKELWKEITLPKAVINSTPSCLGIVNV
jgi:predicted O-methyltransferase YrrM